MRVNVYHEEILKDGVSIVSKQAETGVVYYGIRFNLKSAPELHFKPDDDDRSAVTFWCGTIKEARELFGHVYHMLIQ